MTWPSLAAKTKAVESERLPGLILDWDLVIWNWTSTSTFASERLPGLILDWDMTFWAITFDSGSGRKDYQAWYWIETLKPSKPSCKSNRVGKITRLDTGLRRGESVRIPLVRTFAGSERLPGLILDWDSKIMARSPATSRVSRKDYQAWYWIETSTSTLRVSATTQAVGKITRLDTGLRRLRWLLCRLCQWHVGKITRLDTGLRRFLARADRQLWNVGRKDYQAWYWIETSSGISGTPNFCSSRKDYQAWYWIETLSGTIV